MQIPLLPREASQFLNFVPQSNPHLIPNSMNLFNVNNNINSHNSFNLKPDFMPSNNISDPIKKNSYLAPEQKNNITRTKDSEDYKIKRKVNKNNVLNFNTGTENKFYVSHELSNFLIRQNNKIK